MAAYVISELSEVTDSRLMEDYRSLAQAAIEQYGGRYIVRGGAFETVEGDSRLCRVVIVEFPTLQKAREWYHSPRIRQKAFKRRLIIVEGVQRDIR
jgi:uncharacterized protein (DUF1330 family)